MRKWLCNILCKNKVAEVNNVCMEESLSDRVARIKREIAIIRSRHGWDKESYQDIKVQETKINDSKRIEHDALKAKLLGKKL